MNKLSLLYRTRATAPDSAELPSPHLGGPYGIEAPSSLDYATWANGFNAAMRALTQHPGEPVQQALQEMRSLIVTQPGSGAIETKS